jgi:hypothetical protein
MFMFFRVTERRNCLSCSASSISVDIQSPRETIQPIVETPLASPGNQPEFKIEDRSGATSRTDKRLFDDSIPGTPRRRFGEDSMAQGYFTAFFKEEKRLGMGANGTVYLCQVSHRASCPVLF